jgi:hypothetical protein
VCVAPTPGLKSPAGWFHTQDAARTLQWQLTVSAIVASMFGAAWTLLLFSTPLRPKILHLSQIVAACLLVTHAIILFLSDRWVLGAVVVLIGEAWERLGGGGWGVGGGGGGWGGGRWSLPALPITSRPRTRPSHH